MAREKKPKTQAQASNKRRGKQRVERIDGIDPTIINALNRTLGRMVEMFDRLAARADRRCRALRARALKTARKIEAGGRRPSEESLRQLQRDWNVCLYDYVLTRLLAQAAGSTVSLVARDINEALRVLHDTDAGWAYDEPTEAVTVERIGAMITPGEACERVWATLSTQPLGFSQSAQRQQSTRLPSFIEELARKMGAHVVLVGGDEPPAAPREAERSQEAKKAMDDVTPPEGCWTPFNKQPVGKS